MLAALLNLAVLLGSVQALVSDEFVAQATTSGQKSLSVNSLGVVAKAQNSLLRQERLEQPSPMDVDTDLAKLLGSEPAASEAKISDTDLDLKKLLGSHVDTDSDPNQNKLETPDAVAVKTAASDVDSDEMQKLMASLGQTSDATDAKASAGNSEIQKLMASFGQSSDATTEFADQLNENKSTNNNLESLDGLLGDLHKQSEDSRGLDKALNLLGNDKESEAKRKQLDALMASVNSSSKSLTNSLSELNQLFPLQAKAPQVSSLLQVQDVPDDLMASTTEDKSKSTDSSDLDTQLDTQLTALHNNFKQDKDKDEQNNDADKGLDKIMKSLATEDKDNGDLDKALKALDDDSSASSDKSKDAMEDVKKSLNELNQLSKASLLQSKEQPDQAKDSKKWLDEELAKIGDGWHPSMHGSGSSDSDSSLFSNSQYQNDSDSLDQQTKQHMGDNIDPEADGKWLDDELKKIQSKNQDDKIANMAQQQLNSA